MSIFIPDPQKLPNTIDTTLRINFPSVDVSNVTPFGSGNPSFNKITQYNIKYNDNITSIDQFGTQSSSIDNYTKNIRITLTERAIRQDKYNWYDGFFDPSYPDKDVYSFCNPEIATVFQCGNNHISRKTNVSSYPNNTTISSVKDSIKNNRYGSNFSFHENSTCNICPSGLLPEVQSGKCGLPTQCLPDPGIGVCPDLVLNFPLKNTIYGYAFYLNSRRNVNIPNIDDPQDMRCWAGHNCNETVFLPQLILNDDSIINASNYISLDNVIDAQAIVPPLPEVGEPIQYGVPYAPYSPVPNNVLSPIDERSDSFTFTIPDMDLFDCSVKINLDCRKFKTEGVPHCHNGLTMVFLVGQRSDNDEYVILFQGCLAPQEYNARRICFIPCVPTTAQMCSCPDEMGPHGPPGGPTETETECPPITNCADECPNCVIKFGENVTVTYQPGTQAWESSSYVENLENHQNSTLKNRRMIEIYSYPQLVGPLGLFTQNPAYYQWSEDFLNNVINSGCRVFLSLETINNWGEVNGTQTWFGETNPYTFTIVREQTKSTLWIVNCVGECVGNVTGDGIVSNILVSSSGTLIGNFNYVQSPPPGTLNYDSSTIELPSYFPNPLVQCS